MASMPLDTVEQSTVEKVLQRKVDWESTSVCVCVPKIFSSQQYKFEFSFLSDQLPTLQLYKKQQIHKVKEIMS